MLNGLETPAIITDTAGTVTNINKQACQLFGVAEHEAIGLPATELLAESSDSTDFVSQVLNTEEDIQQAEETITVGSGDDIPVERTVTPLYDADEQLVGVLELNRDITEKKRKDRQADMLESYQAAVTEDLQDALGRLADGDLTIAPTVQEPPADFAEINAVYS